MIICISANPAIDRRLRVGELRIGEVNRAKKDSSFAGGKAAHVAMAALALGERDVTWIGVLGGATGEMIEHQLIKMGITVIAVWTAEPTRINDEIIDGDGRITEILEPGGGVTPEELYQFTERCDDAFAASGSKAVVAISGSLQPEMPVGLYGELLDNARSYGARSIVDTSGEALRASIGHSPDLIKPNSHEVTSLMGVDDVRSPIESLTGLRGMGARDVAISLGQLGALFSTAGSADAIAALPPQVNVISTVGCGDAMVAGFAVGMKRRMSEIQALRLAVACGTANCLADSPGKIILSDVESLIPNIELETVAIGERTEADQNYVN